MQQSILWTGFTKLIRKTVDNIIKLNNNEKANQRQN